MNKDVGGNSDAPKTERHLHATERPTYALLGNKWAVIVGVSLYRDARLNLRYADRDAKEFCQLLQTPSGGGFQKERICDLHEDEVREFLGSRNLRGKTRPPGLPIADR